MEYRKEIDGIRAFAVIPVILFHAGFSLFSGGFVGVDIFFVISGYLITSLIISEMKTDSFQLKDFYLRRMRRILPALFLMLLTCIPLAMIILLPTDLKEFSQSLVSVVVFSSNILFWMKTGYFASAAELKPLLHTWSLSIEEQYYLLFPLFLILVSKYEKINLFWLLAIVALFGFGLAQLFVKDYPSAAFYFLPMRGWEIICGALVAIYLDKSQLNLQSNKYKDQLLSLLGLALIIYAIFQFSSITPFPGLFTLIPVLGTVLLILFTTKKTIAYKIFSNQLFVTIGLMSYSMYLWHQPLFAFTKYRILQEPSILVSLILILLTLLISFCSWKFLESPFRNKKIISNQMLVFSLVLTSTMILSFGLMGHFSNGLIDRKPPKHLSENFYYDLNTYNMNQASEINACSDLRKVFCKARDVTKKNILLIGDSHSGDFSSNFEKFIKKNNYNGAHLSIGGCSFSPSSFDVSNGYCGKAANQFKEIINANKIEKIIFVVNIYKHFSLLNQSELEKNLEFIKKNFIYALERNIEIVYFTPRESLSHPLGRAAFLNKLNEIKPRDDKYENAISKYFQENLLPKGLQVFDQRALLSQASCDEHQQCSKGMKSNRPLYRDTNHLSGFGADFIFNEFLKTL